MSPTFERRTVPTKWNRPAISCVMHIRDTTASSKCMKSQNILWFSVECAGNFKLREIWGSRSGVDEDDVF